MIDFIDLNNEESVEQINKNPADIKSNDKNKYIDLLNADLNIYIDKFPGVQNNENTEEHICIKEDCDASKYYGCTDYNDNFQKKNLFSELTDEYQRTLARMNLGIAESYALKWGNITGNLSNQKDLYSFVIDSIEYDINTLIDKINLKLSDWYNEINLILKNKADIFSPNLEGIPTTTLPLITDNSNRIASTEWVNARIESESFDDNVKSISIDPEYMFYGDDPININICWEYNKEVEKQYLNDIELTPEIRNYTIYDVDSSINIVLKYSYGEYIYSRVVTFEKKYPTFYGTSPDYTLLTKTINNYFTVTPNLGEYIYILIPNGSAAVLMVNSIIGGFLKLGVQEIYNNIYYIFRSFNSGLGETLVEIVNQGNFRNLDLNLTSIMELLNTKADISNVYSKLEIDKKLKSIESGNIDLSNYYTKEEIIKLIPDVSGFITINEVPTKCSQLVNDVGFLSSIPSIYVTEELLNTKGYIAKESDPIFIASPASSISEEDIHNWNNKVSKQNGMGLSQENFTSSEKAKLSGLYNYDDSSLLASISTLEKILENKADISSIPNIEGLAKIADIPTKVSQLLNDSGFISKLPDDIVTEEILNSKGYLTTYNEIDPTVPDWAKSPTKPKYTLEELGAEKAGAAIEALNSANQYTNNKISSLLGSNPEYSNFKELSDSILLINNNLESVNNTLEIKANKSELFSRDYNDLTNLPTIPSIEGLASQEWVSTLVQNTISENLSLYAKKTDIPDVSTKVDKVEGKGLSTNDYTNEDKQKLSSLTNFDSSYLEQRIQTLENLVAKLNLNSNIILEETIEDE